MTKSENDQSKLTQIAAGQLAASKVSGIARTLEASDAATRALAKASNQLPDYSALFKQISAAAKVSDDAQKLAPYYAAMRKLTTVPNPVPDYAALLERIAATSKVPDIERLLPHTRMVSSDIDELLKPKALAARSIDDLLASLPQRAGGLSGLTTEDRADEQQPVAVALDLGKLIRQAREKMGLSQQKFADLAGVGRRFISELENGKGSIEFDKALKVGRAAGLKLFARTG